MSFMQRMVRRMSEGAPVSASGWLRMACGAALVAAAIAAPAPSGAAEVAQLNNQCVAEQAYSTVNSCPQGPDKFEVGQRRAAAFQSAPPPRERKNRQDELGKKQAPEEMAAGQRDLRTTRLQARGRQLLITEISGLERLYKRTQRQSPDRQQLVRRLAEAYVELESAATRDAIKAQVDSQDAERDKQKAKYSQAKQEEGAARKIAERARENAIQYYTRMKTDYPNYSKLDEVLYYLAFEYEQNKDLDHARDVYLELIEKAPDSPYIPNAYLAFGELFFAEAMGDPSRWGTAEQAYKEVVKYEPPKNKVYGYARYKLGYVYWNSGDYERAIKEFKKVIEYGDQFPEMPNAKLLQKSARNDLIPVYAVAGDPREAYKFFKPLSGDEQGSQENTLKLMRDLGLAYYDTGHYAEAVLLYRDLMARDKGDEMCGYQVYVTLSVQAQKASDKVGIRRELDNMLDVRRQFIKESHSDESKLQCSNRTAELLAESAMSWHLEAVGTGSARGTNDRQTMDLASYLYQKVVDNFTQEDFAKFEFPRIVKEDWPNIYKIRYAMADLLYVQQRWEDCGPAFDAVVDANPQSAEAPQAAYAAVLCYQKMYDRLHAGQSERQGRGLTPTREDVGGESNSRKGAIAKLKPQEFTAAQKGMLGAFNRYVCYIKPPAGDQQALEQYVDIKFARARVYFEAQHWEEAAVAFRDIAFTHSADDGAIFAAHLYLEALNVIGAKGETPRPSCFDSMSADVPKFIETFCAPSKYESNKDNCDLFSRIQCDIRRLGAEKTVELADSGAKGTEALELFKKAGDAYVEIWRDYGEKPLAQGQPSQCGRMDEVLYNAARAYQAGRLLAKSIAVRRILLSDQYGLKDKPLAQKAIYEIGGNFQAIAVYDAAADYYMRYAKQTSYGGEYANQALSDAVVLSLGLGNEAQAIDAANAFNTHFGPRKPKEAAQIAFAIAAHYAEKEDWPEVVKRLDAAMKMIDRQASLDVKLEAHALLGRALEKLPKKSGDREFATVVSSWKEPDKASQAILAGDDSEAGRQRRLGKALTAVGEAIFHFAEQKREKAEEVVFPAYSGPGSADAVNKHIQTKVKGWIEKKRPLIVEAEKEYTKVVDLQPTPPPQWVIAAGSRVGGLWGQFVADFRAAPIPTSISRDVVLRTAYYASLDEASEPFKLRAKGAYNTCLQYSVTYQYFDEFSRACEKWLADNYKSEFHLIDEFKGDPNRVNRILTERPYPLQLGGEPVLNAPKPPAAEGKAAGPVASASALEGGAQ
jgi:tetratricopeptide (TPR) repeat protein